MTWKILFYALGVWVIFVVLAIINGAIRERFYKPKLGDLSAHRISTIILIVVIFIGTYLFLKLIKLEYTQKDLILIGLIWLAMTIIFEFVFGHYVMGNPWDRLLADYNILKGRIWSLVLVAETFAPILVGKLL
jgi:hypothetical protein